MTVMALFARSPEECHLYMELHPCGCGEAAFGWSEHELGMREDDQMISVYSGGCGRCGQQRRFEFEVSGDLPPPPTFGRDEPSRIICPGEFLALSRRIAGVALADPGTLDEADLEDGYDAIELAVAALLEVLKFVPADTDAVPPDAVSSAAGRDLYDAEPAQFDRQRLSAELAAHQGLLAGYVAAGG
jgi:hypothetical protein